MQLDSRQKRVLGGMLAGAIGALATVWLGAWLDPLELSNRVQAAARLRIAFGASVLPAISLAVAVGRLARHRFVTPADIDGGGAAQGSAQAQRLQAMLQNTLEQLLLAVLAYAAWAAWAPPAWLSAVPLAALAFTLGRLLFFMGYRYGAAARSTGFALTFYPSLLLLAGVAGIIGWRLVRLAADL